MSNYSSYEALDYWPDQVILIGLYSIIALVSLVFNALTIAVLLLNDKICSELNVYLINQSVSDIVMALLCIPFTYTNFILNRWIFPHFLCPVMNFAQVCSVLVSIWNLTVIGIERYLTMTKQSNQRNNKSQKHYQVSKKLLSIGLIWLVAICSGIAEIFFTGVVPVQHDNLTLFDCKETMPKKYSQMYTIYLFVNSFGLPVLILLYVYSVIVHRVWHHVATRSQSSHISRHHRNMKKSFAQEIIEIQNRFCLAVAKMMLLIVFIFFLCWTPLHVFHLLTYFKVTFLQIDTARDYNMLVYGYLVCHILAMSHSFMNPLVYCCISTKFWKNFCSLMHRLVEKIANCFCFMHKSEKSNRNQKENRVIAL